MTLALLPSSNKLKPLVFAMFTLLGTGAIAQDKGSIDFLDFNFNASGRMINAKGDMIIGSYGSHVALWKKDNPGIILLDLTPFAEAAATAISADGNVIVGTNGNEAFRWEADKSPAGGTAINIGQLAGIAQTSPTAVNDNGNVIAGMAGTKNMFRWVKNDPTSASGGTMYDIGSLGTKSNKVNDVNGVGNVVVGTSNNQAFRWVKDADDKVQTGVMTSLGKLSNEKNSTAIAVNREGNIIAGNIITAKNEFIIFRWLKNPDDNDGKMTAIDHLAGFKSSYASAINAKGDVIVGSSGSSWDATAFRWSEAGGMQSVANWLKDAGVNTSGMGRLALATGINAKGDMIVGRMDPLDPDDEEGEYQYYIARVDSPQNSGIVGMKDLAQSLAQTLAISSQIGSLNALSMNGAHHRTLMDQGMSDGRNCAWVSGDIGRVERGAKGYIGLSEVGACHDFKEQGLRVGLGMGKSLVGLELDHDGYSRLNGQYVVAEIDWKVPNQPLVASLLSTYGNWNAELRRGYAISGSTTSEGKTNVNALSVRARLDWIDAFRLGSIDFSPRIAYTHTRSTINAYQEHGGSAPVRFDAQKSNEREVRAGLTGKYALSDKTTLLGHSEVVHRFDQRSANVSGSVNILNTVAMPFNQEGNKTRANWVRLGAEVDHKISNANILNVSTFVSSTGQDASVTVAASWKHLF